MDPDPIFLKQPDYFRIFIQEFHYIDMCGSVNTSNSISKQDFFGSFAVRLRSGFGSKNFGAGADPDLKILGSAHHWPLVVKTIV